MKPRTIKDLDDIAIIKDHFTWMGKMLNSEHTWDKQLLFFILGINTCYKSHELLSLKWNDLLNSERDDIKDYIMHRGYKFYLNSSCKNALYDLMDKYNDQKKDIYIFSRKSSGDHHMALQTVQTAQKRINDDLNLPFEFSPITLRKTFVYWQIYHHKRDYIKMTKLNELIHERYDHISLHKYSEFELDNDKIYINDINL